MLRAEFRLPLLVLALLALGFIPGASPLWIAAVSIGIIKILWDSIEKLRERNFSLDYIALLAMIVSLPSGEYLAGAIVSFMIIGGEALDAYASARAESALRALLERIPKTCTVRSEDGTTREVPIQEVQNGERIVVRQNELIPLDGTLLSDIAQLNEANLTGEALPVSFAKGSFIKSGAINASATVELAVEGSFETSTYMKIVHLVDEAKHHQPRVVRLAEKFNFPFTAVTLVLSGLAWALTGDIVRALAVLVIATPCPLLIAAPVAFIGGLSRAARANVIVKRPATLEAIASVKTLFFDKTGTLTLGEPRLVRTEQLGDIDAPHLLAIAAAIEFHSIHPLARAVQTASSAAKAPTLVAHAVEESIGSGIAGTVNGQRYRVGRSLSHEEGGIILGIFQGAKEAGRLHFEDVIKENVGDVFGDLGRRDVHIEMLTGDRLENAQRLFGTFGIIIHANQTPESKFNAIEQARGLGTVIMVGDGLNDAPALAKADVGIVFSGTENSAAIEAADAVILSRDVTLITYLLDTAQRSMRIARQSIWAGIGLSVVGMLFASLGFIPPVIGAVLQELLDVAVIINSLRAAMD